LAINDDAALGAIVPPAACDIGLRYRRHVAQGAAVRGEKTPVLGREPIDEGRLPYRFEAVGFADRRDAAEQGVEEQELAVWRYCEIVGVDVAGVVADPRREQGIAITLQALAGADIDELEDVIGSRHPERAVPTGKPHTGSKRAMEN
jgi:hypothetical protein